MSSYRYRCHADSRRGASLAAPRPRRAEAAAEKGACKRLTREYSQVSAKDLFTVAYSRLTKRRESREYDVD